MSSLRQAGGCWINSIIPIAACSTVPRCRPSAYRSAEERETVPSLCSDLALIFLFSNKFLFPPQKRRQSRSGQSQNWWQHHNSHPRGFPRVTVTQDGSESQHALAARSALPAPWLRWVGVLERGSPHGMGSLAGSCSCSRLFSSAFFFCNLNPELTQQHCLWIRR